MALSLHRFFKADAQIVYLSLSKANITKQNPREHYIDRVQVTREHLKPEYQVTLQLSKLKRDDTDLYYCSWTFFEDKKFTMEHLRSNGTVLVVGGEDESVCVCRVLMVSNASSMSASEKRPEAQCPIPTLDLVLVCAGATALILILSFCGVRLYRGRRVRVKPIEMLPRLCPASLLTLGFCVCRLKGTSDPCRPPGQRDLTETDPAAATRIPPTTNRI